MATCTRTASRVYNLFLCSRRNMNVTQLSIPWIFRRRCWLLSAFILFITYQPDNHREIPTRNEAISPGFLAQALHPPYQILRQDEFDINHGTTILQAAKLRAFLQWSRTAKAPHPPRSPTTPAGKGKPEEDLPSGGKHSSPRRNSEASSSTTTTKDSTTSTGQWTSGSTCHSRSHWSSHDDGPDWDW